MKKACGTLFLLQLAIVAAAPGLCAGQGVSTPSAVRENTVPIAPLAGTLFFSPQQRERMERVRKTGIADPGADSEVTPRSMLNGFVKRSDGYSVIWIDGEQRFNIQNESVRQLQPIDVGGPADIVKVSSGNTVVPAPVAQSRPVPSRKPVKKARRKGPIKQQ